MMDWLFGQRRTSSPAISARMTPQEVMKAVSTVVPESEIVRRALAIVGSGPVRSNFRIIWTVCSMTLGSSITVEVDDATGAVISRLDHYGR